MKSAWVRPFSAQDSIRAWVDLNTYIFFCVGGIGGGGKKKINAVSGWISSCVSQGCYLAHLLTSRRCRIALLHSLCIGLPGFFSEKTGLASSFSFCFFPVLFFSSLFPPSFLPSLGCHKLCLLMPCSGCSSAFLSGAPSGQGRWIIFQSTGAAVSCSWPQKKNGLYRFC